MLRSHPFIRIWHAGCSTGEDVYSTDMTPEYTRNYAASGDKGEVLPLGAIGDYLSRLAASRG